ncbi:hypothetical protein SAMN05216355_1122 [Actinomyces ruminicola]|uniref:Uncharacterized protein n=1 Tax=Actinomyces ruminicola TaxID=332524 RepID=A0A1H0DSY5_9ACTO|nr:hypothetical protein [Actinomyces ruminicola]SDN73270.1 hypothetical protein SAMN05216355_1122 [Actinomyces ruminicola]
MDTFGAGTAARSRVQIAVVRRHRAQHDPGRADQQQPGRRGLARLREQPGIDDPLRQVQTGTELGDSQAD